MNDHQPVTPNDEAEQGVRANQATATTRIELDHTALAEAVESIKTALNNFVRVCNEVLPKTDQRITIEVKPIIVDSEEARQAAAQSFHDEFMKQWDNTND